MSEPILRPKKLRKDGYMPLADRRSKIQKAFEYWLANPNLSITELCTKLQVDSASLRAYINRNKLKRPDGKVLGKSDRQDWIAKAYKKAAKEGWTARAAAEWMQKNTSYTCQRGDIQYYAMKNGLAYLPEAAPHAQNAVR